ncbi:hypothetical protein Q7P37_006467 [Cladosporium fusiforme]
MRFTAAVAAATLAGAASASVAPHHGNGTAPAYVTEVVTAYTTYCPEPTEITHAGETYTVSEATTLTITNCPGGCTVTKPATSSVVSVCHDCESTPVAPVPATTAPAEETPEAPVPEAPETPAAPVAPYPSSNGTTVAPVQPSGTGAPTTETSEPSAPFEGAATQLTAGAGLLAVFGLVALL